jgi:hypothetical protein
LKRAGHWTVCGSNAIIALLHTQRAIAGVLGMQVRTAAALMIRPLGVVRRIGSCARR